MFRVAQEALINVGKHARATAVGLRVRLEDHRVLLDVADDGTGFDPWPRRHRDISGCACSSISPRRRRTLDLATAPGRGTTLRLEVPLP